MRHHKEGSIREICYTQFARGFSDDEIIKKFNFNKKTVSGYRYKQHFYCVQLDPSELLDQRDNKKALKQIPMFSANEMDYGTDYPVYKWHDLTRQERGLSHELNHKELRCF